MTRICFWNMRHLSDGTDDSRKNAITTVFKGIKADYTLFCELTTKCVFPAFTNLTYRKESGAQLCYGCLDSDYDNIILTKYTPDATQAFSDAGFKGGNDFTELADRAVGYIGKVNGVAVYVLHAPSGNKGRPAARALSFLACDLNAKYKANPWMVIGDLNVEPANLLTYSRTVGIAIGDLILTQAEPTYIGKKTNKLYDYALCNFVASAKIARIKCSPRSHGSDHYPIVVEF